LGHIVRVLEDQAEVVRPAAAERPGRPPPDGIQAALCLDLLAVPVGEVFPPLVITLYVVEAKPAAAAQRRPRLRPPALAVRRASRMVASPFRFALEVAQGVEYVVQGPRSSHGRCFVVYTPGQHHAAGRQRDATLLPQRRFLQSRALPPACVRPRS